MWVSEKVCLDAQEYFDLVCRAIAEARDSVFLEMYIFREDKLGKRLLELLRRAAKRGVNIRIIVDGFGSPRFNREFIQLLDQQGISARVYHPVPDILSELRLPSFARVSRFVSSINKRNHRKLVIVDSATAFVGSCNVADMHSTWRETAVRVSGAGIIELCRSFELIWSRSSHPELPRARQLQQRFRVRREFASKSRSDLSPAKTSIFVRMNYTRRLRISHNAELANQIEQARQRVWITNAYFVPSAAIVAALLRATRSGCDVKLILPGKTDVSVVSYVSRMFYRGLMRAGVEIYEYQPTVLHAKTLLVDDWACVGTTNLNHRSFYHDLEVDVALLSDASRLALEQQFQRDLALSSKMTNDKLQSRSVLEKLGGYLIYPFKSFI